MTSSLRKFMLTAHVTASVGWVGALAVFLAHAIASEVSHDLEIVRAACLMMAVTAWFVILPLSVSSLLSGTVQALGTTWGLFRHYWVLVKLLLTVFATAMLLLKLAPIDYLAKAAAESTFAITDEAGLKTSLLVHAGGGLVVLLAILALGIYKPAGLTRYGLRKLSLDGRDTRAVHALPQWMKLVGIAALFLLLLVAFMLFHRGHGPGAHVHAAGWGHVTS
jgi:hypothetical protein